MRQLRAVLLTVVGVVLLGAIATGVMTAAIASRRDAQREAMVEDRVQVVADDVLAGLAGANDAATAFSEQMESAWFSPAEYRELFDSFDTSLPGDTASTLVLAVPPSDLEAFVAAEQESNPDFELFFVSQNPPPEGHLIISRSETDEILVGADVSTFVANDNYLIAIAPGERALRAADVRTPTSNPPEQLQIVVRHTSPGPTGNSRAAWTVLQVDLEALASNAIAVAGPSYGASVSTAVGTTVSRVGLAPSDAVARSTATIATGPTDLVVELWSDGSLVRAVEPRTVALVGGLLTVGFAVLAAIVAELRRRVDLSDRDAREDHLTGLPNRRWLVEHLDELEGSAAVLFCDLDRFKVVNDSAGHSVGDELLVSVGHRMAACLDEHSRVARFGGDEFLVVTEVLPGQDAAVRATEVAESLIAAMEAPFHLGSREVRTTMSIGIATTQVLAERSTDELIRAADVALGLSKQTGRNRYALYDESLRDADLDRLDLESDLQADLDAHRLTVHYQPIIEGSGRIVSFEALVRWERNGVLVVPDRFLPIVSEIGRMSELGAIVLDQAVAQLAVWVSSGMYGSDLTLHVNVDPIQLTDAAFADKVAACLSAHGLAPSRLVLELTEHEWFDRLDRTTPVFEQLAALGIGLAIDDFGSGYSSMARILEVEGLTEIKIDRALVVRAAEPRNRAFIAGLAQMARDLEVALVAEGVETVEEHRSLQQAGITLFQGYLFGRPAPAKDAGLASTSPLSAAPVPAHLDAVVEFDARP